MTPPSGIAVFAASLAIKDNLFTAPIILGSAGEKSDTPGKAGGLNCEPLKAVAVVCYFIFVLIVFPDLLPYPTTIDFLWDYTYIVLITSILLFTLLLFCLIFDITSCFIFTSS
jgi:hypothetical protein